MKVVEIQDIKTCIGGLLARKMSGISFVKRVIFDKPISEDFIRYLGKTGKLDYHSSLSKPLYIIEAPGRFTVKGIEGESALRLILYRKRIDSALEYFLETVNRFESGRGSPGDPFHLHNNDQAEFINRTG